MFKSEFLFPVFLPLCMQNHIIIGRGYFALRYFKQWCVNYAHLDSPRHYITPIGKITFFLRLLNYWLVPWHKNQLNDTQMTFHSYILLFWSLLTGCFFLDGISVILTGVPLCRYCYYCPYFRWVPTTDELTEAQGGWVTKMTKDINPSPLPQRNSHCLKIFESPLDFQSCSLLSPLLPWPLTTVSNGIGSPGISGTSTWQCFQNVKGVFR